jgi:branched-chain amino acid transport system substrate-binding protein
MRADARRVAGTLAAACAAAALVVAGCGSAPKPLRVGVVVDCVGVNRPLEGAELAGAELPLVQRGARLRGNDALDGVTAATIAGRPVQLVRGCSELYEYSTLTAEIRRLVEREHVDVVVAGDSGPDDLTVRDVAARYPRVTFLPVAHGPRTLTLQHRAPNVFRAGGDHEQGVAGLATYAYRALGWRTAAIATGAWDEGWGERDAFTAEFCALGGRVTRQLQPFPAFDTHGRDVRAIPRRVDGVAVFSMSLFTPGGFLNRLRQRTHDPRRIVVGPSVVDDPDLLGRSAAALAGVTGSSFLPATGRSPAMTAYLRAMRRTFPQVPAATTRTDLVLGYRTAVETLARGLEAAHGDPARLPAALAALTTDLPGGPQRFDADHSAVVAPTIVRIGRAPRDGALPPLTQLETMPGVDQSIGGLLAPGRVPGSIDPACRRAPAPPWAH